MSIWADLVDLFDVLDSITIQLNIGLKPPAPLTPRGEGVGGWGVAVQTHWCELRRGGRDPPSQPFPPMEWGKGSSASLIK
jgi:hypothetical protein